MIRFLLSFITLMCALTIHGHAGDYADREIIGFSADGNLFAFEQFGVQDGSGFAYAEIFLIDTRTDSWVDGSPYRVLLRDEFSKIADARSKAREMAGAALGPITDRGIIAATNRPDENISNPYIISVKPRSFILPNDQQKMDFRIDLIELQTPDNCKNLVGDTDITGYRLTRTSGREQQGSVTLHEDKSIPISRGCPLDYQPADVVFHYSQQGKYTVVILIRIESFGFEGRDGRFLAVSAPLN